MLVHHRKWRMGEYLVTYTLFVTLLREFLVEIASELGPALDGVEETAPIESCATSENFMEISFMLSSNQCL